MNIYFRANFAYNISTKVGGKMNKIVKFVDDSGILFTKDVIKAGYSKTQLYTFIQKYGYEQVGHGVYASPECWTDDLFILSTRCPQGVFSHDEALYYYGLVDREPMQKTITVYTGYGTGRLVMDGIKVYTVKKELLELGKIVITNSYGHKIPIYDMERTICDLIRSRSCFEIQDFQGALKAYVKRKDKDLNRLMAYAQKFREYKRIREYMEVLL